MMKSQLEAHPIHTNEELLAFNIRSKGISWKNLITPLEERKSARYLGEPYNDLKNHGFLAEKQNRREVLVCHDMMGNYLEDRHFSSSRKWDDYRFYHWSGIDYFCYFSHNYITIPPSNWINAAHLHGVRVLGTIITEGSSSEQLKQVLQSRKMIDSIVDRLVQICDHFCFEGWLLNIECPVEPVNIENLIYFINLLRFKINREIPSGVVFWYDSVIDNGELEWQNEVNDKNWRYFNVSNGILINYSWDDESLRRTNEIMIREGRKHEDVFFGIDVFGRGQLAKFQSHITMERVVRYRFSIGIFAPAWTFEGLGERGYKIRTVEGNDDVNESFLLRNEKFWGLLWRYLATNAYHKLPFYSDFCLGSGRFTFIYGQRIDERFFTLARQSLQPSVPLRDIAERCFNYGINGGSCLKIIKYNHPYRIFLTEFRINTTLIFAYASKVDDLNYCNLQCEMVLTDENGDRICQLICGDCKDHIYEEGKISVMPINYETFGILSQMMSLRNTPMKLPFRINHDNWNIRYYVINFNQTVIIRDIGVNFKAKLYKISQPKGYLGAIYVNTINEYVPRAVDVNVTTAFLQVGS